MMSSSKITLRSSDGEMFEVEEAVARESQMFKYMIEDDCAETTIPVPKVSGKILAMVIDYCKRHVEGNDGGGEDDLKAFDSNFVNVEKETLFGLVLAANYLDIKSLLDLTCQAVADMIEDMKPEEVRTIFNIQNDFTPEEEEAIRKENAWAFEEAK